MANIWRCTLTARQHGCTIQNVLHFHDPGATQTATNVAGSMTAIFIPELRAFQVDTFVWQRVNVKQIEPIVSATLPTTISMAGLIGGGGNITQHTSIAAVWSLRTANGSRAGRGRFYVSGLANSNVVANVVNPGLLSIFLTRAGNLLGHYGPSGTTLLRLIVKGRAPGSPNFQVTDIVPKSIWGIQRRRNSLVGI